MHGYSKYCMCDAFHLMVSRVINAVFHYEKVSYSKVSQSLSSAMVSHVSGVARIAGVVLLVTGVVTLVTHSDICKERFLARMLSEQVGDREVEMCGASKFISWLFRFVRIGQTPGQGFDRMSLR